MLRLLTQVEAARLLRLSERTLERLRLTGAGPLYVKCGRSVRYREADLEAWGGLSHPHQQELTMRKQNLPALRKHFLERELHQAVHDAWAAVDQLYDFLVACHKDGLLWHVFATPEEALKDLAEFRDNLSDGGDFMLRQPEGAPTAEIRAAH